MLMRLGERVLLGQSCCMHGIASQDSGRDIDWGRTSADYARHRPGPPSSFYDRLAALGIGGVGQSILDLGTGTGLLALEFARRGARVLGIDIAAGQIAEAQAQAQREGLDAEFAVAASSALPGPADRFDVTTANQCWLYFDADRTLAELRRVLRKDGLLATSHFSWLPREDAVARASEALVLQYNPQWQGGDWSGEVPPIPPWAAARGLVLKAMFQYDVQTPFTAESWRGRMRACRGVGATFDAATVAMFDRDHAALLARIAPPIFAIRHRIDAHIFALT